MSVIAEIDFFSDEVLRKRLARWSLVCMFPAFVLFWIQVVLTPGGNAETLYGLPGPLSQISVLGWLFVLVLATIAILPIHELIHALFFKLLGGSQTHVEFGYKDGMFYTGCPGRVFSRTAFLGVLLAPAIIVSASCLIVAFYSRYYMLCLAILFLHLSGCVGDILAAAEIIKHPACTHCEDTECGLKLLAR